jgi:hypothetical protein
MPSKVNVAKIKTNILQPALTSHFLVDIEIPKNLPDFLKYDKLTYDVNEKDRLRLLCCEATLPGSSLATHENNSDFTGVTQKFAYRRLYDDRIDLTFYVDAENYLPISLFEIWIKFIAGESVSEDTVTKRPGSKSSNYFYRVRYPKEYIVEQGFKITKFEKTSGITQGSNHGGSILRYEFVDVFPIAITSMPVSYDTSSLLKCTVSFSYTRYYINYINNIDAAKTRTNQGFTSSQLDAIDAADIRYTQAVASKDKDEIAAADIEITELWKSFGVAYPIFQRIVNK